MSTRGLVAAEPFTAAQ